MKRRRADFLCWRSDGLPPKLEEIAWDGQRATLEALLLGCRIGRARLRRYDGTWKLEDISLDPEFRYRGLGDHFLQGVLAWAKEKAAGRITGEISPSDLRETPRLPDWYRKHGFRVFPSENPQFVYEMEREL